MFNNAFHALEWAYNTIEKPLVKMSAINRMREGSAKGMTNDLLVHLSADEMHKQAANIIGLLKRLPDPAEAEYINAKFGRKLHADDLRIVVNRGCCEFGIVSDRAEAVYKIMYGYFVKPMSHRATRRVLGCRDQYAVLVKNGLYELLDLIHDRAMADMTVLLMENKLIRDREKV